MRKENSNEANLKIIDISVCGAISIDITSPERIFPPSSFICQTSFSQVSIY
jgi:hypothetical protein